MALYEVDYGSGGGGTLELIEYGMYGSDAEHNWGSSITDMNALYLCIATNHDPYGNVSTNTLVGAELIEKVNITSNGTFEAFIIKPNSSSVSFKTNYGSGQIYKMTNIDATLQP